MEMEKKADEIYASGFLSRFASGETMAVVSAASKLEQTSGRESAATLRNLKASVRALGLGYAELKSSWTRTGEDGKLEVLDERSLAVYGLSLEKALEFGKELGLASVVFKNSERCVEACSSEFADASGKNYRPGDVVQVFNRSGDDAVSLARDVFEQRRGTQFSVVPLEQSEPLSLSKLEEVVPPSGAVFSTIEKYVKIF